MALFTLYGIDTYSGLKMGLPIVTVEAINFMHAAEILGGQTTAYADEKPANLAGLPNAGFVRGMETEVIVLAAYRRCDIRYRADCLHLEVFKDLMLASAPHIA